MDFSCSAHEKASEFRVKAKRQKGTRFQRDELRGTRDERSNASSPLPQKHSEFREKPRFRHSAKDFRVSALPIEAEEAPRFRAKREFRDDASGHYRPTNKPHYEPPRLRPPQGGWAVMGLWRGMKRWMPLSVSADIKGHGLFIPHLCQPLSISESAA